MAPRSVREPAGMDTFALSTGYLTPSLADATVVSTLDVARVLTWGRA